MPTIRELEDQVNASRKLIRKFLVDECGAIMEQGKTFVATDEQASLVASHFGARPKANTEKGGSYTTSHRIEMVNEVALLREEKARLEERVRGLDAQIALYQIQLDDLRHQLSVMNEALQSANKVLEESAKHKVGFFASLFGRRRIGNSSD